MIKIKKIGKENKSYWPESDIEIKEILTIRSLSKLDSNLLIVSIGEPHGRHIMIIRSKNSIMISILLQNCNCGGARIFFFYIFL